MTPKRLDVMICVFSYGGNGGLRSEVPDIRDWVVETVLKIKKDSRIENVHVTTIADTPITMSRNHAIELARHKKADVLVMLDSDMQVDCELRGDPTAKPFWDTSFDAIYEHYEKGPLVIFAPYCGMSPFNNVFVFQFTSGRNAAMDQDHKLEPYTREHAAMMAGIQPAAAGPTGVIMFDMRMFDVIDPPYFDYEWTDEKQHVKASTEDVMATRTMSMIGLSKLNYNPMHCNWDAWAGHWKPELVRKPRPLTLDQINEKYRKAALDGICQNDKRILVGGVSPTPPQEVIDFWNAPMHAGQRDMRLARSAHVSPGYEGHDRTANAICDALNAPDFRDLPESEQNARLHRVFAIHGGNVGMISKADDEVLLKLVSEHANGDPIIAVEVGCWLGQTSRRIFSALPEGSTLYCVDHWKGSPQDPTGLNAEIINNSSRDLLFRMFKINTSQCGEGIVPVRKASIEAAEEWEYEPVDMVFIDAEHTYEAVKADIRAWVKNLRPDGIICGHDYRILQFPGVEQAVNEVLGEVNHSGAIWWKRIPRQSPMLVSGDGVPPEVRDYWARQLGMPFEEYYRRYGPEGTHLHELVESNGSLP